MTRYRNKIEIVADILEATKEGAKKTHVIYRGNLSFKLAAAYLNAVLKAGLVMFSGEEGLYRITEKGRVFLQRFSKYCRYSKSLEKRVSLVRTEQALLEEMCLSIDFEKKNDFVNAKDALLENRDRRKP